MLYNDCCHRYDNTTCLFSWMALSNLTIPPVHQDAAFRAKAFVFNRCPPGTNEQLKRLCEQPEGPSEGLDRKAVVISNDTRLLRNAYCAMCYKTKFHDPKFKLLWISPIDRLIGASEKKNLSHGITLQRALKIAEGNECQLAVDLGDFGHSFQKLNRRRNIVEKYISQCRKTRHKFMKSKFSERIYNRCKGI